ncbi:MAG: helix-turn-helix domain-containing protein [Gaiellaceae bacterium]
MTTTFKDYIEQNTDQTDEIRQAQRAAAREAGRVGAQLLKRRLECSMTQTQLSDRSGVPQPEISKIERGLGNPTEDTLFKLASAMDAHLDVVPNHAEEPAQLAPALA